MPVAPESSVNTRALQGRCSCAINYGFATMLIAVMLLFLVAGGWALWKHTRFA
jgi:hypothetical protein